MKFELTKMSIYRYCAYRIRIKMIDKEKKQYELYKENPKVIGQILNCEPTKRNPYLIQYAVANSIKNELEFESLNELLWNVKSYELVDRRNLINNEESNLSETFLIELFRQLIIDLMQNPKYNKKIIDIFSRYVSFAQNLAYYETVVTDCSYADVANILNIDIVEQKLLFEHYLLETIDVFFDDFKFDFAEAYIKLAYNDTYSCLDKTLLEWSEKILVPKMERYLPRKTSIALEIKNDIQRSLEQLRELHTNQDLSKEDIEWLSKKHKNTGERVRELEKFFNECPNKSLFM